VEASRFERAAELLLRTRSGEGFGPVPGAPAEAEPTALAAIALDDEAARRWLVQAQHEDGSFGIRTGGVVSTAATSLAALALPPGSERELALDHLIAHPAEKVRTGKDSPGDGSIPGWGWTEGTAGWVEPTSRAILALRRLRPQVTEPIEVGVRYLANRECIGGGWNYGNRLVYDVELPPYGQTTALALVALRGHPSAAELVERGTAALRRLWPVERGPLTLAVTLAAFRLLDLPDAEPVATALDVELEGATVSDAVALAWAAIASGPGLSALELG